METAEQNIIRILKPTEKERLDLIETRLEIQKKRLEIKKEKLSMDKIYLEIQKEKFGQTDQEISLCIKHLEIKKSKLEIEILSNNKFHESERMLHEKINSLLLSLIVTVVDDERTILGSEPFKIPIIAGQRRDIVLNKLMELINSIQAI